MIHSLAFPVRCWPAAHAVLVRSFQETFQRTYVAVEGRENEYRKVGFIIARRMEEPFAIKTASGVVSPCSCCAFLCSTMCPRACTLTSTQEQGMAGDYLAQNEQGDQWAINPQSFAQLYEEDAAPPTLLRLTSA